MTFGIKAPYEIIGIDSTGDGFGDGQGGSGNSVTLPHQTNNGKTDISDACILGGLNNPATAAVNTTSYYSSTRACLVFALACMPHKLFCSSLWAHVRCLHARLLLLVAHAGTRWHASASPCASALEPSPLTPCFLPLTYQPQQCVANPSQTSNSGLAPCTQADYDPVSGYCWRIVTILITNGAACSLDHTIRIPVISIYCAAAYPSADCPLGPASAGADNSTGVSVTIRADNFCAGDRALVINGAIVIQSYVPQRQLTRANDKNVVRAYSYGETVYLLLTINQTASLKVWLCVSSVPHKRRMLDFRLLSRFWLCRICAGMVVSFICLHNTHTTIHSLQTHTRQKHSHLHLHCFPHTTGLHPHPDLFQDQALFFHHSSPSLFVFASYVSC